LNRTSVAEILTEEGLGRLLRHPALEASTAVATPGRDTNLSVAAALDFAAFPDRCDTTMAGPLLVVPDLIGLDLPALIRTAGYPGTRAISRGQLTAVPAVAQAHRHPPCLPR
jgi:hypothetical protein